MKIEPMVSGASNLRWTRSSYSGGNGGECVEVALAGGSVHVRDSKDREGARLTVGREQWTEFVRFALGDARASL